MSTLSTLQRATISRTRAGMAICVALSFAQPAHAWVLTINPGPRTIYLQVGNGSFTGTLSAGGTPINNTTVNAVTVTVPATALGTGTAQQMTSNSTASLSFYDNFAVCNPPAQVYIGGWARLPAGTGTAILSVTTPANLVNGANTIPFNKISWTSTASGSSTADIPAGTFTGGTQTLRNIAAGTWVENCLTFSYANTAVVPQGTYSGRATYSLTMP